MVFLAVLFPTFGIIPAFNDHLAKSLFQEDPSGGLWPSQKYFTIFITNKYDIVCYEGSGE